MFKAAVGSFAYGELDYSTLPLWCRGAESNCGHQPFQGCALPTELPRHGNLN